MSARIVILTKAPAPGRVKTRLATTIGPRAAAQVHEEMVLETIRLAKETELDLTVSLASDDDGSFAKKISALGAAVEPQSSGDLGARLTHAMRRPGLTIALGTDCVVFDPHWLIGLERSEADVTIGPSDDGGYWTIALDGSNLDLAATVFSDMPWSKPTLFAATNQRLESEGLSVRTLPGAYDVDDISDLHRLLQDARCPESLRKRVGPLL